MWVLQIRFSWAIFILLKLNIEYTIACIDKTCFDHCGFLNFVGPQPELSSELNEHFAPVEDHDKFENINENALCFDDNEDMKM